MKTIFMSVVVVLFISFSSFIPAKAQVDSTITLNPRNPEPRSRVTLELQSYSYNVNTAKITWKNGDRVLLSGEGASKITLQTGDVGQSSTVTVISELLDGTTYTQSVTITPSSVVLLYEAPKSYVPITYEGRSLPADGGSVRVSALASIGDAGALVSPSSLSYSWYVNGLYMKNLSGRGKQVATFDLDYLKNGTDVKVQIQTPLGNVTEKSITIYPHDVMPLLYTFDPILGTNFNKVLEGRYEATKDFTLALEPFYVSDDGGNRPATNVWYLDGLPSTPIGGRILSFHPRENSYGLKNLLIQSFGSNKILQKAEIKTELIFDTRK